MPRRGGSAGRPRRPRDHDWPASAGDVSDRNHKHHMPLSGACDFSRSHLPRRAKRGDDPPERLNPAGSISSIASVPFVTSVLKRCGCR